MRYPTTPDGRYFVVKGKLWRCSNPALTEAERSHLVKELMKARRAVKTAMQQNEPALETARAAVNAAKIALGERGAVWWADGAPDYNQQPVHKTPYADWYKALPVD
ncbi:hypothetical protein IFO70_09420 [Phormidium tenue FACHB-886]|nr:hypothetical protein [Phormidium tenue FACHB-886]